MLVNTLYIFCTPSNMTKCISQCIYLSLSNPKMHQICDISLSGKKLSEVVLVYEANWIELYSNCRCRLKIPHLLHYPCNVVMTSFIVEFQFGIFKMI